MQYYTVVGDSYEDAVRKAREQYGSGIRIHSRRDYTTRGGLFTRKMPRCEIICYLASGKQKGAEGTSEKDISEFEKEARTPDPKTLTRSERLDTEIYRSEGWAMEKAAGMLDENHITDPLRSALLEGFPSTGDAAVILSERIIKAVGIDYGRQLHPHHFTVFIGPTGSGKTTTLAKVAHLFRSSGRSVAMVSLDSYRTGAYEQISAFGKALSIPVAMAGAEDELLAAMERFASIDMIFIDTMGISPRDKELTLRLRTLLSLLDRQRTDYILTVPASMKEEDITEQYLSYSRFSSPSLAVTKLDETGTLGNVLSFAYSRSVPILFFTDGQKVPDDIEKASGTVLLEHLKGIGLDMKSVRKQLSIQQ